MVAVLARGGGSFRWMHACTLPALGNLVRAEGVDDGAGQRNGSPRGARLGREELEPPIDPLECLENLLRLLLEVDVAPLEAEQFPRRSSEGPGPCP